MRKPTKRVKPKLVPIASLEPGQSGWLPFDPKLPEVPRRKLTLKYATVSRARVFAEKKDVIVDGEVKFTGREELDVGPNTMVEPEE